jgi:hypothetical protein
MNGQPGNHDAGRGTDEHRPREFADESEE